MVTFSVLEFREQLSLMSVKDLNQTPIHVETNNCLCAISKHMAWTQSLALLDQLYTFFCGNIVKLQVRSKGQGQGPSLGPVSSP